MGDWGAGPLAVKLGGLHTPLNGSVTVDKTAASTYGLTDAGVYRISVSHAKRKKSGSSFRLTLSGFYTATRLRTRTPAGRE